MKILVVKSYHKGDTVVFEEAVALKRLGHDVEAALPRDGPATDYLRERGVPVHIVCTRSSLVSRNFAVKRVLDLAAVLRLRKLFTRYDVIHLNLQRARVLGRVAATGLARPAVVSTIHGEDLESRWLYLLERLTQRIDRVTVAISNDVKSYLVQKGIPPSRIAVVYNGVDIDQLDLAPRSPKAVHRRIGIEPSVKLVGMIARFYPVIKGHEVFVRAAARVIAVQPDVHFVVAGGPPFDDSSYFHDVQRLAGRLGVKDRLHFLGEVDHSEITKVLDSLEVLVVPSLVREGFGLVIAEAMARQVPVIGSAIGAIPEVIGGDRTGLLVPPGDDKQLAATIISLLSNEVKRVSLGVAGRTRVRRMFSLARMARDYEAVFAWACKAQRTLPLALDRDVDLQGSGVTPHLERLVR